MSEREKVSPSFSSPSFAETEHDEEKRWIVRREQTKKSPRLSALLCCRMNSDSIGNGSEVLFTSPKFVLPPTRDVTRRQNRGFRGASDGCREKNTKSALYLWNARCELFTILFSSYLSAIQIVLESNSTLMASGDVQDESLYPIAVLIDELRNEDVQVRDWENADGTFFLFV